MYIGNTWRYQHDDVFMRLAQNLNLNFESSPVLHSGSLLMIFIFLLYRYSGDWCQHDGLFRRQSNVENILFSLLFVRIGLLPWWLGGKFAWQWRLFRGGWSTEGVRSISIHYSSQTKGKGVERVKYCCLFVSIFCSDKIGSSISAFPLGLFWNEHVYDSLLQTSLHPTCRKENNNIFLGKSFKASTIHVIKPSNQPRWWKQVCEYSFLDLPNILKALMPIVFSSPGCNRK